MRTLVDEALDILIGMAPAGEGTGVMAPERGAFYRELSRVLDFLARCYEQANEKEEENGN